jgi:hypothetical protein
MNSLAIELIDAIIGHVDEKDNDEKDNDEKDNDEKDNISRSDLLNCSLVCRFWLPSSQRRLFHHIDLRGPGRRDPQLHGKIQRLDQVLLNSPHLASYTRALELPDMMSYGYFESDLPGWAMIDKPLCQLLPKFTQLQKLKISGLDWDDWPEDFRQSLCRVLELPSMAFVCIYNAQFPLMDDFTNFINHARGIIGLSLDFIVPRERWRPLGVKQGEGNKQRFERHRNSHLTRLDMRCGENTSVFVDWLLEPRSHFGVSHIHTLHIRIRGTGDDSVNRLLRAIGRSLKHVSIALPYVGK